MKKYPDIGQKNEHQPPFYKKVYRIVAKIPKGKVSTYGAVARASGSPKASRAVGNALRCNRDVSKVPCHRVVKNNGTLGGYAGGLNKKEKLLREEGISIKNNIVQNFESVFFES